ncbi:hypothetical protein, partial [Bacteroides sp.]|uniref:hypothetical protein n=1 Tax=Bacteroides sp. TaxID=29523 RepID=UPI002A7FC66B
VLAKLILFSFLTQVKLHSLILYWNISIIVIHNGYQKIIDLFKYLQTKEANHANHLSWFYLSCRAAIGKGMSAKP